MSQILNLRKIAAAAVEEPTFEDWYRSICRWFSKNYHTPLPMVEDLPQEYVILHYFEVAYEEMQPIERQEQIQLMLETEEEKAQRLKKEQDLEDAFMQEAEKELADSLEKEVNKSKHLVRSTKSIKDEPAKESPILPPEEDEIKIEHVDDFEFDRLLGE